MKEVSLMVLASAFLGYASYIGLAAHGGVCCGLAGCLLAGGLRFFLLSKVIDHTGDLIPVLSKNCY